MSFKIGVIIATLLLLVPITQVTSQSCSVNGNIRLTSNRVVNNLTYGLLQLCNGSLWTAVCDYNWQCSHAIVACRQLGPFSSSTSRIQYQLDFGPTTIFGFGPYRSSCSSSYTSLLSCSAYSSSYRNDPFYCNPTKDTVGLNCNAVYNSCIHGSVRLVNNQTSNTREGRIEYCHEGKWSPICTQYTLDHPTAYNLCFELGYRSNSYASIFKDGRFGIGSLRNWFQYLSCSSSSPNLLSRCSSYTSYICPQGCSSSYNHYGIRCYVPVGCNEGSIRLVNGTVVNEGRLEVCTNGVWGSICGSSFGLTDALVVCRELGYNSGGYVSTNSAFGSGNGPIVYKYIGCGGYEKKLIECSKSSYLHISCERSSVVGVSCWDGCTNGDVRLTGGSKPTEGTVEICYNRIWGLVSQIGWKDENSQVVCDQLGYENEDTESVYDSLFGKPNRTVYLSNVDCDGLEDRLIDCTIGSGIYSFESGKRLTPHVQVIGVRCQGNETYRTFDYSISISSVHLNTSTGSITITPHLTEPGLGPRENAVVGVGGTMIIIAIIAIITVVIIIGCFIRIQRKATSTSSSRNLEAVGLTTLSGTNIDRVETAPNHSYETPNVPSARPAVPGQKPRGKPRPGGRKDIEVIYD